jgi:hypothetical protein
MPMQEVKGPDKFECVFLNEKPPSAISPPRCSVLYAIYQNSQFGFINHSSVLSSIILHKHDLRGSQVARLGRSQLVELVLESHVLAAVGAVVIAETTAHDLHVLAHVDAPGVVGIAG